MANTIREFKSHRFRQTGTTPHLGLSNLRHKKILTRRDRRCGVVPPNTGSTKVFKRSTFVDWGIPVGQYPIQPATISG